MSRTVAAISIGLAFAASVARSQTQPATSLATGKEEQTLLALEREWADAEVKHDAATLDRVLDDRFLFTDQSGQTTGKAEFIRVALKFSMESQTAHDETVRIFDDAAVIVGIGTIQPLGGKAPYSVRYTTFYIKRQGRWRAVAEQLGRAPAPAAKQ